MREIQASEAKTHLPHLLDAVERGEIIVITRRGRAIARIVSEAAHRQAEIRTRSTASRRFAAAERYFRLTRSTP
jgi:prevent-host-death family protein